MAIQIQVQGDTVAEVLQATRGAAGLTTRAMADRIGVSHTTVAKWEKGLGEPSVTQFMRWAQATGQPVEALLSGINAETPAEAGVSQVARPEGLEPPTFWSGARSLTLFELWASLDDGTVTEKAGADLR